MAKFCEDVLEFKVIQSFNRLPITCTEDKWYITNGKNSVTKIQDSKSIYTWTLLKGQIHYFTTPVAYFKGKLYSVMDDAVLLKWSDEDLNLENIENIKFQEVVHSIIQLQGEEPLIIFQSGKFVFVDVDTCSHLKPLECVELREGDYLKWVDAAVSTSSINIIYLIVNKKSKQSTLYHFSVSKEDKTILPANIFHLFHETAILKVCCLSHQDLSFFSLWSDGTLRRYNVRDSSDKIIMSLEDVCMDTIIDICCIDSKHIIIVKGKSQNGECFLQIWDTEHAVLRGSKQIEIPELVSLQVSTTDDYIFLYSASGKLLAIPYSLDSSFASTLNTYEPKEFQQLMWNTDLEVKPAIEDESMDISFLNSDSLDSAEKLIEKLLNEDSFSLKFISESELMKILQLIIRHQKEKEADLDKDICNLQNIVFSASFNDMLLMKHLKSLTLEDTLSILDILLKNLKQSVIMPVDVLQKPTDLQIVNWICLVISSHTETLLFTKDKSAKKILKELKNIVSVKIQEFEDLEGLQSYLSMCCDKKNILPQQNSAEKYCLETLDI